MSAYQGGTIWFLSTVSSNMTADEFTQVCIAQLMPIGGIWHRQIVISVNNKSDLSPELWNTISAHYFNMLPHALQQNVQYAPSCLCNQRKYLNTTPPPLHKCYFKMHQLLVLEHRHINWFAWNLRTSGSA